MSTEPVIPDLKGAPLLQFDAWYSSVSPMSKITSTRRLNRFILSMVVLLMLICFASQAQAAVLAGLAKVKSGCGAQSSPSPGKGMKHPDCCGPKCCCDVQQDRSPIVPDSAALLSVPSGGQGEAVLLSDKPQPGTLREYDPVHPERIFYLPAGPVYTSPLNLLC